MGLKVVVVDARQAPLDLVKSLKYAPVISLSPLFFRIPAYKLQDYAIDATKGVEYALSEIGGGVDAVITATDVLEANEYGLRLLRKHGTFVVIGA